MYKAIFCFCFAVASGFQAFAGDVVINTKKNPREVTLQSSASDGKIDIEAALRAFVENLIEKAPKIEDKYYNLLTKNADGETYAIGDYNYFESEVVYDDSNLLEETGVSTEESERVFLVMQPIYDSSPKRTRGDQYIVFKVRVREEVKVNMLEAGRYLFDSHVMSLRFERLYKLRTSKMN